MEEIIRLGEEQTMMEEMQNLQEEKKRILEMYNDLRFTAQEMHDRLQKSVDISPIVAYLEEFIETERMRSHRAPKGSDFARIASFRANDAEDILNRLNQLLPKKVMDDGE